MGDLTIVIPVRQPSSPFATLTVGKQPKDSPVIPFKIIA
jgi:hypothetical protein